MTHNPERRIALLGLAALGTALGSKSAKARSSPRIDTPGARH